MAKRSITSGDLSTRLVSLKSLSTTAAGVLAGTMSTLAAKALAISSLFVRNVYRYLRPEATQDQGLTAARWTIVVVLGLGVLSAELMGDVESIVKLVLTVNVPFGAAILTGFFWRRLTAPAVWWSVSLTVLTILVVPNIATEIRSVRQASELAVMSTAAEAKPVPVYWKQLVRK